MRRGRSLQRRASSRNTLAPRASADNEEQLDQLCRQLISARGEASGSRTAQTIIQSYSALTSAQREGFFIRLATDYAPDWEDVRAAFRQHEESPGRIAFQQLSQALEPPRQELFRRINRAQGGTQALVQMRVDLLQAMREKPELGTVDDDLVHLLRSWFNRGFLVMEPIDWSTPADLLERVIRYEAVHQIGDWDELRRRLMPSDRRCYAFFHPALTNDPLIFVEVALTRTIPDSIQNLLASEREPLSAHDARTAVFYSISNCQKGLHGISFGSFLIKQVVEELLRELPGLDTFVTLSPVPGFRKWFEQRDPDAVDTALLAMPDRGERLTPDAQAAVAAELLPLAAEYLLEAKDPRGRPLDPVARFHLGNGARLERLCWPGDTSVQGMASSAGLMVNYLYDLENLEENHEAYANHRAIVAGEAVRKYRKKHRRTERESLHVG
jgi:malonyl-CoA decarboxylase